MSARATRSCASCRFFSPAAQDIERHLPGLRILSSAFAAVRSDDGLCRHHERYVAASSDCDAHLLRVESLNRCES
jgi:hypothetical protein